MPADKSIDQSPQKFDPDANPSISEIQDGKGKGKASKTPVADAMDKSYEDEVPQEETRGDFFLKELDAKLTMGNVKVAVAIIVDPESENGQPYIYARGSTYANCKLLCDVTKQLKEQLMEELSV